MIRRFLDCCSGHLSPEVGVCTLAASIGRPCRTKVPLTAELRQLRRGLDALLAPHIRPGPLPALGTAAGLRGNPALAGADVTSRGPSPSP